MMTRYIFDFIAGVAKLVDARDSKSRGGNTMSVRVRPSAPVYVYPGLPTRQNYAWRGQLRTTKNFSIELNRCRKISTIHTGTIINYHVDGLRKAAYGTLYLEYISYFDRFYSHTQCRLSFFYYVSS
jgi:hypothetical protein